MKLEILLSQIKDIAHLKPLRIAHQLEIPVSDPDSIPAKGEHNFGNAVTVDSHIVKNLDWIV